MSDHNRITYETLSTHHQGASQKSVLHVPPAYQVTGGKMHQTSKTLKPENHTGPAIAAAMPKREKGYWDADWGGVRQQGEGTSAVGTALLTGNLKNQGKRRSIAALVKHLPTRRQSEGTWKEAALEQARLVSAAKKSRKLHCNVEILQWQREQLPWIRTSFVSLIHNQLWSWNKWGIGRGISL